jgi:hypothetical protein
MPYMLHAIGEAPETGKAYETKALALADRADGQTVTLVASEDERQTWIDREQSRFYSGAYKPVPWQYDLISDATRYHFAHVSLDVPGMIAYTPDDEKGLADRQTRVKPGRYLQQFFSHLTPDRIADYASRVKAYTSPLQLATTPDDIARVYCAKGGPTSCMDGRHFDHDNSPTRVYGHSDLAIAYIGDISGDDVSEDRIAARAIVWPAKMRYGRVYGDCDTLQHVLESAGYSYGSMCGARVRAIEARYDGYVMPYVDGIGSADLSSCGQWFVLGDGDYDTQNTNGTTGPTNSCNHCGERCDRDESYCSSCEDDRHWCEGCEEDYFDSDAGVYSSTRGEWRCNDCWESRDCEACSDTLHEYDYSRRDWPHAYLCSDCEHKTQCEDCGEYVDNVDSDSYCSDCRKCSDCGEVCDERSDRDDKDRCPECHDQALKIRLTPKRPAGRLVRLHRVGVTRIEVAIARNDGASIAVTAEPLGAFYLHPTIEAGAKTWTITHRLTGLAVTTRATSEEIGRNIARDLASLDWSFMADRDMPADTRREAPAIIGRYLPRLY